MTRLNPLSLAGTLLGFAALAVAAPAPEEAKKTPISAENAPPAWIPWLVAVVISLLVGVESANAQNPYNVTVNVTELSRIFTELYGPEGLVVNSQAALAGGVSHSAHFNSAFESEFSQFGTALTGQIVSLPLPAHMTP